MIHSGIFPIASTEILWLRVLKNKLCPVLCVTAKDHFKSSVLNKYTFASSAFKSALIEIFIIILLN